MTREQIPHILVTGAFGNLGAHVLDALLQNGLKVTAFDLDTPKNRKVAKAYPSVTVYWGDIRDKARWPQILKGVDGIIHNAALLPPATDTAPELARQVNVDATKALIEAAGSLSQPPVFVYPSSLTVFGLQQDDSPRSPSDPVSASDNYTEHKIACENLLQASNLPWVILRVGVSIDEGLMRPELETLREMMAVKADNRLEYVHPKDVATAMANAVIRPEAQNKILLIGGGAGCQITQHQFLGGIFDAAGISLPASLHGQQTFYTHWMDTNESQAILEFQHISFNQFCDQLRHKFRYLRWLTRPLSPLVVFLLKLLLKK